MDVAEVVESHIMRNDVPGLIGAILARARGAIALCGGVGRVR